jgi:uncharacterized membrane protein
VIVIGFIWAVTKYYGALMSVGRVKAFSVFQARLGIVLLLGLEILVIADVIESITVKPSYTSLAVLAVLVLLRTIVSWTTDLHVEGRWPWQAEDEEENANV